MSSKKELSPTAKEYKKTYERWFYGVLLGFALTPFLFIPLFFAIYCLFESQRNYKLYKAAMSEKQAPGTPTVAAVQATVAISQGMNYCEHCGHRTSKDSAFCERCGERLS